MTPYKKHNQFPVYYMLLLLVTIWTVIKYSLHLGIAHAIRGDAQAIWIQSKEKSIY